MQVVLSIYLLLLTSIPTFNPKAGEQCLCYFFINYIILLPSLRQFKANDSPEEKDYSRVYLATLGQIRKGHQIVLSSVGFNKHKHLLLVQFQLVQEYTGAPLPNGVDAWTILSFSGHLVDTKAK